MQAPLAEPSTTTRIGSRSRRRPPSNLLPHARRTGTPVSSRRARRTSPHTLERRLMTNLDRANGVMNGIAIGNLLGITVEGWSRNRILRTHPDGLTDIEARSGYPDDDDVAQSIIVAESAANGPLRIDDLGRKFWDWAEANGAGIGGLTRHVLALYGGDDPQRLARNRSAGEVREPRGIPIAEAAEEAWAGYKAGNGALMRCAPLAIRWHRDHLRLVRESIVSAVPTHWDRRCGWSCAIVNLAIAGALRHETLSASELVDLAREGVSVALPELHRYGYEPEPPTSVVEVLDEALRSQVDDLTLDGRNMGYRPGLDVVARIRAAGGLRDGNEGTLVAVHTGHAVLLGTTSACGAGYPRRANSRVEADFAGRGRCRYRPNRFPQSVFHCFRVWARRHRELRQTRTGPPRGVGPCRRRIPSR